MLQFQPAGFEQRVLETSLGIMAYYTQAASVWPDAESQPAVVFLHSLGGGSSAYEWSQVYGAIAADYRVIAPDLIGWGQSAHPAREYCVADYCQVIGQLLEAVTQPPALVAATSLTAGVTIRLAAQRPDLFRALFLVSPSGNDDFGQGYRFSLPAQLAATPGLNQLIYALGAANEAAVTQFLSNFLFADPSRIPPELVQAYLTGTQQPNAEYSALASLKGDICFDLARYIGQLTTPTVFVLGEASRFSRPEFGKRLAQLNPHAVQQVHVLPELGVLPHVELPAVVVGFLRAFLRERLATSPLMDTMTTP